MADSFVVRPKRGESYKTTDFTDTIGNLMENGMVAGILNEFTIIDQGSPALDVKVDTGRCILNGISVELDTLSDAKTMLDSGTNHIWITLQTNGSGRVTGAAIETNNTGTEPTDAFVKIGEVVTSGGDISSIDIVKLTPGLKGSVGSVTMRGNPHASIPTGEVDCAGQSLSTTLYKRLFDAIGYLFGGSGANFNVPDMHTPERFPRGAASASDPGAVGGLDTVKLTGLESGVKSHTHTYTAPSAGNGVGGPPNQASAGPGATTGGVGPTNATDFHENKPAFTEFKFTIKA